jgi:hypothetical protein
MFALRLLIASCIHAVGTINDSPCHSPVHTAQHNPVEAFAVTVAPAILREYPALSDSQLAVIAHDQGPLLAIAGPGSGKTFSMVLRTITLLLLGKAMRLAVMQNGCYTCRNRAGPVPVELELQ